MKCIAHYENGWQSLTPQFVHNSTNSQFALPKFNVTATVKASL